MSSPSKLDIVAKKIIELQNKCNDGRGVSCARHIADYLDRGQEVSAITIAMTDADKLNNYPELVEYIQSVWPYTRIKYGYVIPEHQNVKISEVYVDNELHRVMEVYKMINGEWVYFVYKPNSFGAGNIIIRERDKRFSYTKS